MSKAHHNCKWGGVEPSSSQNCHSRNSWQLIYYIHYSNTTLPYLSLAIVRQAAKAEILDKALVLFVFYKGFFSSKEQNSLMYATHIAHNLPLFVLVPGTAAIPGCLPSSSLLPKSRIYQSKVQVLHCSIFTKGREWQPGSQDALLPLHPSFL